MAKKIFYFIMLFLYVLGTINGIGYSIYIGEWVTAIGVAVLTFMAWPTAVNYWKFINGWKRHDYFGDRSWSCDLGLRRN